MNGKYSPAQDGSVFSMDQVIMGNGSDWSSLAWQQHGHCLPPIGSFGHLLEGSNGRLDDALKSFEDPFRYGHGVSLGSSSSQSTGLSAGGYFDHGVPLGQFYSLMSPERYLTDVLNLPYDECAPPNTSGSAAVVTEKPKSGKFPGRKRKLSSRKSCSLVQGEPQRKRAKKKAPVEEESSDIGAEFALPDPIRGILTENDMRKNKLRVCKQFSKYFPSQNSDIFVNEFRARFIKSDHSIRFKKNEFKALGLRAGVRAKFQKIHSKRFSLTEVEFVREVGKSSPPKKRKPKQ